MPFVGACIHVPPPPANQIIYVKSDKGFEVTGAFDPVSVVGTMKTETAFTGLADAGYSIEAESVDPSSSKDGGAERQVDAPPPEHGMNAVLQRVDAMIGEP